MFPKPTPLLRFALLAVGVGVAQLAYHFLGIKLLAYVAGLAGPFCLLCLSSVWAMRDKGKDYLSPDGVRAEVLARFQQKARELRHRSLLPSAAVAVASVFAAGPAISHQLVSTIWQWSVLVSGASVAFAAYQFLVAAEWERQLQDFRDEWVLTRLREAEREALLLQARPAANAAAGQISPWGVSPDRLSQAA